MHPHSVTPIILLSQLCSAFLQNPSYVDAKVAYEVSVIEDPPEEYLKSFKSNNKQQVLGISTTQTQISLSTGLSLLNSDSDEEAYYVNVTVGAETYQLLLDTGSPYIWLYDSDCTDSSCKNKELYNETSDGLSSDEIFDLAYTTGTASGSVVGNDIGIAGYSLEDFMFGAADEVPDIFEKYSFNGVLGIPNHNESSSGINNIFQVLKDEGLIDSSKFSLCLGEYNSSLSNAGLLVIGESIDQLYTGDVYYTEALNNTHNYWEVKIDNVFINNYHITFEDDVEISGTNSSVERLALLDSGTTSLTVTPNDAVKIHSFFDNSVTDGSNYAIYCNTTLDISFEIGGHNWTLSPDDYLGNEYTEDSGLDGYCVSNIQGLDVTSDNSWILGASFLRTIYAEFNIDESTVGLAERNSNVELIQLTSSTISESYNISTMNSLATSVTRSYSKILAASSSSSSINKNGSATGSASSTAPENSGSSLSHSFFSVLVLGISILLL